MYERFVIWGTDDKEQKVLLAIELVKESFKADIHVLPKTAVGKELEDKLRDQWIKGEQLDWPEHRIVEQKLTEESLLPTELKVAEPGKIRSLQNEWSYIMLQHRLLSSYLSELEMLKEKADQLIDYDKQLFEDTKSFWDRILEQRKERNISNEKVDEFKKEIDLIFEKLKNVRTSQVKEYGEQSQRNFDALKVKLETIHQKIKTEKRKAVLFDELKNLRAEYNESKLNKQHRFDLNSLINDAFDKVKHSIQNSVNERVEKRLAGLQEVVDKISKGLEMDRKDVAFNENRMNNKSDNQLEIELRKAKVKMLKERIESKENKLKDIFKTMDDIRKGVDKG